MSSAEYLRETFACTKYIPYWNADMPPSDHLLTYEICWYTCGVLHLVVAIRTKRLFTYLGILVLGAVLETIGYAIRSHAHNQFRIQITCFLPLKEVLWYGSTMFMAIIVAEYSRLQTVWQKVILAALIAAIQNISLEMVNSSYGMDNVYMNVDDFEFGDFNQKVNGAIITVVISVFTMAFGAAIAAFYLKPGFAQVILVPFVGTVVGAWLQNVCFTIKYFGCLHFIQAEATLFDFHQRCDKYSTVSNHAVLAALLVIVSLCLLYVPENIQSRKAPPALDDFSKVTVLLVALITHGAIIYNMLEGARLMNIEKPNQMVILITIVSLHVGLAHIMLNGGFCPSGLQRLCTNRNALKQEERAKKYD